MSLAEEEKIAIQFQILVSLSKDDIYILLDVLLCSVAEYFYELCRILTSP